MSIATVVTRGYGSFGTIGEVVTRGYSHGEALVTVYNGLMKLAEDKKMAITEAEKRLEIQG